MKNKCQFKPMQLVKAIYGSQGVYKYPWKKNEILLFLGEIKQMEGHCAVVNKSGKIFWAYHTDDFVEPLEEEI